MFLDRSWPIRGGAVDIYMPLISGQRGTIAKSMHEEHLCIVALTSNGARNPVLSACLLPPCVIAYCSSSTSR